MMLIVCLWCTSAFAKVTLNSNFLTEKHILTLKGLMYEAITTHDDIKVKIEFMPKFAAAIVWLDKIHKDKKVHELHKYKTETSELLLSAIDNVIHLVNDGQLSSQEVNQILKHWAGLGERVLARYKKKNGKLANWKLSLKKIKTKKVKK